MSGKVQLSFQHYILHFERTTLPIKTENGTTGTDTENDSTEVVEEIVKDLDSSLLHAQPALTIEYQHGNHRGLPESEC